MSNYPPGAEFDPDAPFNQNNYEYEIIDLKREGIYMVVYLQWDNKTPDDSIYFPEKVKIDMDEIYYLIDKKLGRG